MAYTIPSGLFSTYAEYADAMLATSGFGTVCKLVYVEKIEVASTTVPNVQQKKTMNLQRMGNDNGFRRGDTSYKTVETTEEITLRTYWTKKDFKKISNIDLPDGAVMCIGNYSDLSNIQKASFLLIETNKTGHQPWKFEKAAEPMLFGLDNNYLVSYWKRV